MSCKKVICYSSWRKKSNCHRDQLLNCVSANATDDRISSQSRKSGAKRSLKLKALERRNIADSTIMKWLPYGRYKRRRDRHYEVPLSLAPSLEIPFLDVGQGRRWTRRESSSRRSLGGRSEGGCLRMWTVTLQK